MSLVNTYSNGWYDSDSDGIPFIVCSTVENEWVPVFVPEVHIKVPGRNMISGEWFYYITIPDKYVEEIKTRAFRSNLETQRYISCIKFPKTNIVFYVKKGLIYEVEKGGNLKILLCSAYNKENPSIYNVFVHPDVLGDVTYTRIKYYVLKYFVYESTTGNNEMVVTYNIEKKCFSPTKIIKHFGSVEQEDYFLNTIKGFIANVELPVVLPTIVPEVEVVEVEEILEPEVEFLPPIISQVQIEQVLDELPVELPTAAEFVDSEDQIEEPNWIVPDGENIQISMITGERIGPSPEPIEGDMSYDMSTGYTLIFLEGEWVRYIAGTDPITDDSEVLVTAAGRGVEIYEQLISEITEVPEAYIENSLEEGTSYGYVDDESQIFRQEGMVARRTRRNHSRSFRTGGIS